MAQDKGQPPSKAADNSAAQRYGRFIRFGGGVASRAATHPVAAAVTAGCALLLVSMVAWYFGLRSAGLGSPDELLEGALAALDRGELTEARYIAEKLRAHPSLPAEDLGGPAFIQGAVAAREAETMVTGNRDAAYLLAARYLEEARDRGFPPNRDGEGLFLLGKMQFLTNQFPASRPILKAALSAEPQRRAEIHRLLALAYSHDTQPRLAEAQTHIDQYLATPRLSAQDRHTGLLDRARILMQRDDLDAALATLEQIPEDSPLESEVILLRGQVQLREARRLAGLLDQTVPTAGESLSEAAVEQYRAAIETFGRAEERDTLSNQTTRKAMYLKGVSYFELNEHGAALEQWQKVRQLHRNTPEGLAAALGQAGLLRTIGRDDEALADYRLVLSVAGTAARFSNPWFTVDELRLLLLEAYGQYLANEKFAEAVALAQSFGHILPTVRAIELEAEAQRAWGQYLLAKADTLVPDEADAQRHAGREHLRIAGSVFARLARLRIATRHYPDDVWKSAQGYLEGQNYTTAAWMLEEYLEIELRDRRPLALVAYGEALAALGRDEEALAPIEECLEQFPRDVAAYKARLIGSWIHEDRGEFAQSEALLLENLEGDYLTPASKEWRQSLFALGRLLYYDRRYEAALPRLEEAVARYGEDPAAIEGRYLIAESCRQVANTLAASAEEESIDSARRAKIRDEMAQLERALERYNQVHEILTALQSERKLTKVEAAMLRNSYFGRAASLVGLGRFAEAIGVYATATNRYQTEPEGLEAYVQIAFCYRRLHKFEDAHGTLEQAKVILKRMEPDAPFAERTDLTRGQWEEWLDWLIQL